MNRRWFSWNNNSCRYDSFFILYTFIIKPYLDKLKLIPAGDIIDYLNKLSNLAINLNQDFFELGIWDFFNKNKNNFYDFTSETLFYKKQATFYHLLDLFRCNELFCCKYELEEGCSNCGYSNTSINFLNSYITIREINIIKNIEINSITNNLLLNELTHCSLCGYKDGRIIDINNPKYYRIFKKKFLPKFIFIVFDLLNENDYGTDEKQADLELKKRCLLINDIIKYLKNEIFIENQKYILLSIINAPFKNSFYNIIK